MSPRVRAPVIPSRPEPCASSRPHAPPFGRSLAQHQRGARRRVDLHPVMRLDDLDVPVGIQRLGHLLRHPHQKVDAKATCSPPARSPHDGPRAAIFARCSCSSPVVPITCTARACAASAANSTVAAGEVKSTTACALAKASSGSSVTVTPSAGAAHRLADVAARSRHARRVRRIPPAAACPTPAQDRISVWPIRPDAPVTTDPRKLRPSHMPPRLPHSLAA